jgi:hypothetical protein
VVELIVTGVYYQSSRAFNTEAHAIRNGMAYMEELHSEMPYLDFFSGVDYVDNGFGSQTIPG